MTSSKPILLIGSPRSGSTWVGRMIAESSSVRYLHEPFNISNQLCCSCGVKFDYWFTYISRKNASDFHRHFKHLFGSPFSIYNLLNLVVETKTTRRLRPLKNYARSFLAKRPLVKDPLATFSAEWLASTFDMDVIVLIRHPAAVISSYKRLNWSHSFSHFLDQPLLMKDLLYPFEAEIREYTDFQQDIIDQGILLWKLIHHTIKSWQEFHPDWLFVRHEDLSLAPVQGFQKIFNKLNLRFSDRIGRTIEVSSDLVNPLEADNPYSIQLNSRQSIWNWRNRLTKAEIKRIRLGVEEVSYSFYSDEDW